VRVVSVLNNSSAVSAGLNFCSTAVQEMTMNKDEIKGKFDQAKGKVKQGVGEALDDEQLHDEGVVDEASGDVQEGFGKLKSKVGEAIKDVGDRIKH
jgi:uncharacterized protein YjbJ (UPF0337 family)